MNKHSRPILAAVVAAVCTVAAERAAAEQPGSVIIEWNQILQQHAAGAPFAQVRTYAMVHIAMADAVAAIERTYKPYRVNLWAPRGASAEAAAAQAAHDVLAALVPAATPSFDAALEASLAAIPEGRRWLGVQVGRKAALEVLEWRQNDGAAESNPSPPVGLASLIPGRWRVTATGPAQWSEWGFADTFALVTPTQYLPGPPPQLESAEYAEDFEEVKSVGRAISTTRTPEQTRFAQLVATAGPSAGGTNLWRVWHNVARDLVAEYDLSLATTARLFALLSATMHDSLQTSQVSKFVYQFWRPETAIDQAGVDQNDATSPEAGWAPLVPTPAYPSHASNAACISAGAARALANQFHGDAHSFTATWYTAGTNPAVAHAQPYESLWALAQDQADARIWGGIHFRFEIEASQAVCPLIADWVFDHYMKRRDHRD